MLERVIGAAGRKSLQGSVTAKARGERGGSARELRDRFLEQVNGDASLLLPAAKYEVARALLDEPRASASGSGSGPLPHGRGSSRGGRGSLPEIVEVRALPPAA